MSQESLARELEVSTNTISRWETGVYRPAIVDLEKLSRFFGVSVLEFFPSTERPTSGDVEALLRAAEQLPDEDLAELRRYAEYRRAQSLLTQAGKRKRPKIRKRRE